jgi:DNA-binding NarL/FixJ family response regulator
MTPIKVLLADDDALFLESLEELVGQQPELAVVGRALNGLEAIELADRIDPDAAVVDLHMPLLDGVTAIARLRHDHPSLCVIALTADDDQAIHRAASEAGADAIIEKHELARGLVDRLYTSTHERLTERGYTPTARRGSSAGRAHG